MSERIEQLKNSIERLENKDFGIYFFTMDTKGNPTAAVANIYEHVKILRELGYNAAILHEKNDYKFFGDAEGMGLADWLGPEYVELPHVSIESKQLQIGPADFVIIPEIFAGVMKQTANFPCKRIVFLQAYEYIFEMMELGENWASYGINQAITTNQRQKEYVQSHYKHIKCDVVPVGIPDYFVDSDKPKKPVVAISARDKREILKVVHSFYQKYPQYRFITFRDMSGMPREDFAEVLGESFLSIWIDDLAGFGTFPIESIKCNTPVLGKIPRMVPEYMGEITENGDLSLYNNGIWTYNINSIPDVVATMVNLYLEDNMPENILNGMGEYKDKYTIEEMTNSIKEVYGNIFADRIEQLTKIKSDEEAKENAEVTEGENK
jgi:hypothetical protein